MKPIFLALFSLTASVLFGQTTGTLTFSVTTVNYSAPYSPAHILAIWISNDNVQWVKTRKYLAQNPVYRQYLTNFRIATGNTYNAIDAITGPTLPNHVTHTVSWDGKDVNGNLVADGNYRIYIEFTSANATGKLHYIQFTKGPQAQMLTPANQPNFTNMSLSWAPKSTVGVENEIANVRILDCFPNPFSDHAYITLRSERKLPVIINIYNNLGQTVKSFILNTNAGYVEEKLLWDGTDQRGQMASNGIYFIGAEQGGTKQVLKVIKQ